MSGTNPIPQGCEHAIPHLVVQGASDAIDFYKNAFGAEEICRMPSPDGRLMHAEIKIGNSIIYLCDDFPEYCDGKSRNPKALGGSSCTIHTYVHDTDAAMQKALDAGANVKMPATDMFWGDRYGTITDPFGHDWSFATHVKDMTPEEMDKAAAEMFSS